MTARATHRSAPPEHSKDAPLASLDAVTLVAGYRERAFSPVEVIDAILERIDGLNPAVNAYVTVTADLARRQARAAEREYARRNDAFPPMLGVPFSVKDTILTRGVRTTMGSRTLSDWVPTFDAPAVERCLGAGGVLLGKTNSPEFGWKCETTNPLFGTTRNPWNLDRTPGGSSGGAAAAVALGLGSVALGTDAAGSIRLPAAFCGVVGYKPSFGRIPMAPGGPIESLGHIGVLARSVRDVALVLGVTAGRDPRDRLSSAGPVPALASQGEPVASTVRAAWSADLGYAVVEDDVLAAVTEAAGSLSLLGWDVEPLEAEFDDPYECAETLLAAGMAGAVRETFEDVRPLLDPERVPMIELGFTLTGADVGAAILRRAQWVEKVRLALEPYDVLVTPSAPLAAFTAGISAPPSVAGRELPGLQWAAFGYPFNLTGQPAISLPCGRSPEGLPIGLQLVGRADDDAGVLAAAAAYEARWPWHDDWPPSAAIGVSSHAN